MTGREIEQAISHKTISREQVIIETDKAISEIELKVENTEDGLLYVPIDIIEFYREWCDSGMNYRGNLGIFKATKYSWIKRTLKKLKISLDEVFQLYWLKGRLVSGETELLNKAPQGAIPERDTNTIETDKEPQGQQGMTALEIRKAILRGELSKEQGLGELKAMEFEINAILLKTTFSWGEIENAWDFIVEPDDDYKPGQQGTRRMEVNAELKTCLENWTPEEVWGIFDNRRELEGEIASAISEKDDPDYTSSEIIEKFYREEFTKSRALGEINLQLLRAESLIKFEEEQITEGEQIKMNSLNNEQVKKLSEKLKIMREKTIQEATKEKTSLLRCRDLVLNYGSPTDLQNTRSEEEPIETIETTTEPEPLGKITWIPDSQAGFERLYAALRDGGYIPSCPKSFAAAFIKPNGEPMTTPRGGNATNGIGRDPKMAAIVNKARKEEYK